MDPRTTLTNEMITLPRRADAKPATTSPSASQSASMSMPALMTRVKSPRVRRMTGKAKNFTTGLMKALTRAKIAATTTTSSNRSPSRMPATSSAATQSAAALMPSERSSLRRVPSGCGWRGGSPTPDTLLPGGRFARSPGSPAARAAEACHSGAAGLPSPPRRAGPGAAGPTRCPGRDVTAPAPRPHLQRRARIRSARVRVRVP